MNRLKLILKLILKYTSVFMLLTISSCATQKSVSTNSFIDRNKICCTESSSTWHNSFSTNVSMDGIYDDELFGDAFVNATKVSGVKYTSQVHKYLLELARLHPASIFSSYYAHSLVKASSPTGLLKGALELKRINIERRYYKNINHIKLCQRSLPHPISIELKVRSNGYTVFHNTYVLKTFCRAFSDEGLYIYPGALKSYQNTYVYPGAIWYGSRVAFFIIKTSRGYQVVASGKVQKIKGFRLAGEDRNIPMEVPKVESYGITSVSGRTIDIYKTSKLFLK